MKKVVTASEMDAIVCTNAYYALMEIHKCVGNLTVRIDQFYGIDNIDSLNLESLKTVKSELNKIDKRTGSSSLLDALWNHIDDALDEIEPHIMTFD